MAKPPRASLFEIGEAELRAGWGGRAVTFACAREGDCLVVEIDSGTEWSTGEDIGIEDVQRLFALIERECDARGIDVEFE